MSLAFFVEAATAFWLLLRGIGFQPVKSKPRQVGSNSEWVKQWLGYPSHYLPVVATGLIPRIYRRAAFPHRATPKSLPL